MGKNKSFKSNLIDTGKLVDPLKKEINNDENLESEEKEVIHYKGNWFMVFFNTAIALLVLYAIYQAIIELNTENDYWLLLQKIGRLIVDFLSLL